VFEWLIFPKFVLCGFLNWSSLFFSLEFSPAGAGAGSGDGDGESEVVRE
jgi:hypothetical protein